MPSSSPFCIKVETYLRMMRLDYENEYLTDPRLGPRGKLPYIEYHGEKVTDSRFIVDFLEKDSASPLNAHLTEDQCGMRLAMQRLLEEHLIWVIVYSRWVPEKNWKIIKNAFFNKLPGPVRTMISKRIRKKMLLSLRLQGIGLHTQEEIYELGKQDIQALSHLLADKPFILGDKPTTLDASAYGFIVSIIRAPIESGLKRFTMDQANLVALCDRIDELYYNDKVD
jgi:glutathione S-transferase